MAEKSCKQCRTIFEGQKCTQCGSTEFVDKFKGRVAVLNPDESVIAKNLNIKKKGHYSIKLG
ncbi:MAG: transcription elongation factor subunit Spt4 [archaeon]